MRLLDAFHDVRLGQAAVDDVRRRRQQEAIGRRGHRDDPLYRGRRLLRRGFLMLNWIAAPAPTSRAAPGQVEQAGDVDDVGVLPHVAVGIAGTVPGPLRHEPDRRADGVSDRIADRELQPGAESALISAWE